MPAVSIVIDTVVDSLEFGSSSGYIYVFCTFFYRRNLTVIINYRSDMFIVVIDIVFIYNQFFVTFDCDCSRFVVIINSGSCEWNIVLSRSSLTEVEYFWHFHSTFCSLACSPSIRYHVAVVDAFSYLSSLDREAFRNTGWQNFSHRQVHCSQYMTAFILDGQCSVIGLIIFITSPVRKSRHSINFSYFAEVYIR